MTKHRAFAPKSCQNISSSVRMTKSRAFASKSCQNVSSSVEMTKSRAFAPKSCQNISSSIGMTKSTVEKSPTFGHYSPKIYSVITIYLRLCLRIRYSFKKCLGRIIGFFKASDVL